VTSEVAIQSVPSRRAAVVRQWLKWTELGGNLIPLLDRVYVAVRAGQIIQTGQNIFIYRDGSRDGATVEVGVEVAEQFQPVGEIIYSETPAGDVAAATHTGPYSGLAETHQAVHRWCRDHGHALAGTSWEVYGDWREDPAQLETEVCYALRPMRP
jgi:effector-binding domain-containing protein